jgi:immunoglobulin-like protein involved in spore germination
MKRVLAAATLCLMSATLALGCGGGDDDPEVTPSPQRTATTEPSGSPTIEAGIAIDEPAADEEVTSPITMSGRANVFEGALTIDAVGNNIGLVFCIRHLQATAGTGTEGTWEGVLSLTPPDTALPITCAPTR